MITDDKSLPAEGESKESAKGGPACFWRRPRTKTALLCAGFLVIGLGLGSIATSAAIHGMVRHGLRDPERLASKVLSRMRSKLDLTDEQAVKILPMLEKRFGDFRDAVRSAHKSIATDIEPVLTPEQRVIHERMTAERRERFLGKSGRKEDPE